MRTTLTLEEDVAAKLKAQARRSGKPFREVVNDTLRRGFAAAAPAPARGSFVVKARDLGALRPGLNLDNIGALLEHVEGPLHR